MVRHSQFLCWLVFSAFVPSIILWGQEAAITLPSYANPEVDNSVAPLVDLTDKNSDAIDGVPGEPSIPTKMPKAAPRDFENGSQLSEMKARSSVTERYVPQRFKVYPDDPDSHYWETNVRTAFARSRREMRPMLLLFTARWRPEAMALSSEVFATKSFNNYVKENLVICYLDFPSNTREAAPSMQWAKKEFKVAGYPSVLIFNPKGEVVRSIRGYRKGRPVDYFGELQAACAPALAELENSKSILINEGYRNWSNHDQKSIFAKFINRGNSMMTLQDAFGQNWTIEINQLSQEDRSMALTFPNLDQIRSGR